MKIARGVHIGTAMNKSNSLLQFPSFSYVPMYLQDDEGEQEVLTVGL